MDRKTKIYILIFALVIVLGVLGFMLLRSAPTGTVAVITVDGSEYSRIDLSRVKESYDIELETEFGKNTIHVEPGSISVSDSDCPDRICVNQGRLSGGGLPIICMPHRLIISIEGSDIDA